MGQVDSNKAAHPSGVRNRHYRTECVPNKAGKPLQNAQTHAASAAEVVYVGRQIVGRDYRFYRDRRMSDRRTRFYRFYRDRRMSDRRTAIVGHQRGLTTVRIE